jgi:hypothetical protein
MIKDPTPSPFSPQETRGSNRILHVLCSSSLDRQLASGTPPGWSRSLAARADGITTPQHLRCLAEDWEHLLHAARRPATMRSARVPLCRDRILAAEGEIRGLIAALSEARLGSAAGVATASLLLRDGTGPLYSRRCTTDLVEIVLDATMRVRNPAAVSSAQT